MKEWSDLTAKKADELLLALERLRLGEYIRFLDDRRGLMLHHFLAGVMRGLGMAVGFTILGAVLVLVLQRLAQRNLPLISDFLAQLLAILQRQME